MNTEITQVTAREILDSRGNPTVEAEVILACGTRARASVPGGASTGEHEAHEWRDGERGRYGGRGVRGAVQHVRDELAPALLGMCADEQAAIDMRMRQADGTPDKGRLGANALLAVSLAVARAAARAHGLPLYRYLGGPGARVLPVPMMNVINGGAHSDAPIDFQEFMIMPVGFNCFSDALRCGSEVYHALGDTLRSKGLSTAVGDEGGYAPPLQGPRAALDAIMTAISRAGYEPGRQVYLALDAAASEFYSPSEKLYRLKRSGMGEFTVEQLVELYEELLCSYPIISLEDGCAQNDWESWQLLTRTLGQRCCLVGDDLFVTNTAFLRRGIAADAANAILIKPNQIGTLTETLDTLRLTSFHPFSPIISHRSGETEDPFIADLAVACNCGRIKAGAPCRTDRLAKYNRLLRIEEQLGQAALYGATD